MDGRRHPTIYDVAERAGVSIGTVSRTINTPGRVSETTRRRVLDAVRDLDFVAKETAISRARRGTRRVAVLAPFTSYPSFSERLNGVMVAAENQNIEIVVQDMQSAAESADVLERLPAVRSVDGLVIMSIPFGHKVDAALRRGRLPAVLVDVEHDDYPSVGIDDVAAGHLASETFLGTGRSRPAFFGHRQIQPTIDSPAQRRLRGYSQGLASGGVALHDDHIVLVSNDLAEAQEAATHLLRGPTPPDAIFAHSDELAAAVLAAASTIGIRVPDQLAVIGFDDSPLAPALGLTTLRQPLRDTGSWALRTLLASLDTPEAPQPSITLPVRLVRRNTA